MVISHLLERSDAEARPAPGPFDWMDWERAEDLEASPFRRLNRGLPGALVTPLPRDDCRIPEVFVFNASH